MIPVSYRCNKGKVQDFSTEILPFARWIDVNRADRGMGPLKCPRNQNGTQAMKKLLVALTAALGFAAASVPASAGGSYSVSAYISAPVYSQNHYAPRYSYVAPSYTYAAPVYVAPRYYAPAPVVTFSFGKSYYKPHRKYRKYRKHRRHHGHKHHRRAHRNHW